MCGIAGVISSERIEESQRRIVNEMTGRMVHRGPDSDGFLFDRHVALGMRRLSIIDLAGGRQPIFNETGDVAVICNGEIYNHVELRDELKQSGHKFRTRNDVETIVHLYEDLGKECLGKLRGMFAFALWDSRKQVLLLARDRIGEKPLYLFRESPGRLWFASEIRTLCAAIPKHSLRISPESAYMFLTFQYVPEPYTPIEGITLLEAGHYLELSPENPSAEPEAYWKFLDPHMMTGDPVSTVRASLGEACRLMGTADVPVGVALSAGIDSSVVAALTSRHYPGQVQAFTVGYPGRPHFDERTNAGKLAARLGVPFHEVELSTGEVLADFPELVWRMDTPVGDIAAYGYYAVSRAAREAGVPVLLSGMGGDEMFWGYEWVRVAVARNNGGSYPGMPFLDRLKALLGRSGNRGLTFFEVHDSLRLGEKWARQILPGELEHRIPPGLWLDRAHLEPSARMDMEVSDLLIRTWLRSNCLTLSDRMSMAHGVELRLPLLDPVLIETVIGLRNAGLDDWRLAHKWLLIEAAKDILPREVFSRNKQGFTPPVSEWYDAIVDKYLPLVYSGTLVEAGIFDPIRLRNTLPQTTPEFRYKLVLLETWARQIAERA